MVRIGNGLFVILVLFVFCIGSTQAGEPPGRKVVTEKEWNDLTTAVTESKQKGDIAWMMIATALVMCMIPGLALFYGGMVQRKNAVATMMQSMVPLALIGVYWVVCGYALAFGPSQRGLIGWSIDLVCLQGVKPDAILPGTNIPVSLHLLFQGMFAIIAPALICGAIVERVRFLPYCLFVLLWSILVYTPLAHWVWAMDWFSGTAEVLGKGEVYVGWLGAKPGAGLGALDFAGGTVVHIAAGVAGLAACLVIGKRRGFSQPHHSSITLIGAGLLWFGWFGFNAGSATSSGSSAATAFLTTQAAAAGAGLIWLLIEWRHHGKPTAIGFASGIVAGLVAVTPACGYVSAGSALLIGLVSGAVCYAAVNLKKLLGYDDSLDAFGVHGVGGFVGALMTGWLWSKAISDPVNAAGTTGLLSGGGTTQLMAQLYAAAVAACYSFGLTWVLVKTLDLILGFRSTALEEQRGLDPVEHGECMPVQIGIVATNDPLPLPSMNITGPDYAPSAIPLLASAVTPTHGPTEAIAPSTVIT